MTTKTATLLIEEQFASYSFNRSIIPFPIKSVEKVKPPAANSNVIDSRHLFPEKKEKTFEEQAKEFMDGYRKAQRLICVNFYTGGGVHRRGIMDSLYRGFSPGKM